MNAPHREPSPLTQPEAWNVASARTAAQDACSLLAPLWPLRHFVAVNPFLGFTGRTYAETCEHFSRAVPGGMQMELIYYREKLASGEISLADLDAAVLRAQSLEEFLPDGFLEGLTAEALRSALLSGTEDHQSDCPLATFTETVDKLQGTHWSAALVESVTDFCAAWFDEGQSAWPLPWRDRTESLYLAWKEHAALDRQPEFNGLSGFRQAVEELPDSSEEALAQSLEVLGIDPGFAPLWLHHVLFTIRGWAGYLQYQIRETERQTDAEDNRLTDLLAIRVAGEAVARKLACPLPGLEESWPPFPTPGETTVRKLSVRVALTLLAQLAHEHAWERKMKHALSASGSSPKTTARPETQAVFCIDVRSEIFRRTLESVSPGIHTSGFAGFFGLPIAYQGLGMTTVQAQCPVLLQPQYTVRECHQDAQADAVARRHAGVRGSLTRGWNAFKTSAISCFSFVETSGLLFGGLLLRDGFGGGKPRKVATPHCGPSLEGIASSDRVSLARGILKNLGLTRDFARLVLLCGHGSETSNNPYGSGLDCGACGGHAGDANARVGAALLNDPAVRAGLASEHGISLPEDTWFLAGLHNTTTDEVTLFDLDRVPPSHRAEVAVLGDLLGEAGKRSRHERAALLGITPEDSRIDRQVCGRARDWSQVRPEWGLAGNAAFVAAPRSRTSHANLGGRVFLHDYNWKEDPDNSILELIMSAPMVVANWINLQYYASTVNNAVFGSGNKVLHNVVGTLGVCIGNQGDLQTGLPLQSVHDGERFIHEPIRLHVFLEAPQNRIDSVIGRQATVRDLVDHQWLHIFSIDENGGITRRMPGGEWE